jgi:hypothetical protein
MVQLGKDLRFAAETGKPLGITREGVGQRFERDVAPKSCIARTVDLSHTANAEWRNYLERADPYPRNKRHDARLNVQILTWTP